MNRSVATVVLLSIVTLGIYAIVWLVKTKQEMVQRGAQIPTAWLLIVPIANIYWLWKWSEGVAHVTKDKMSGPVAFLLTAVLGIIGVAIIQSSFNQHAAASAAAPALV